MPVIGANSALSQKEWRSGLSHEAERQCFAMGFVSREKDAPILLLEDLSKKRGDEVRWKFSPTDDTKDGFGDTEGMEGLEEGLELLEDSMRIDRLKAAFSQPGEMSQQRVNADLKQAAFVKLSAKWARRWEQTFFNHLCGFTPAMYKIDEGAENGLPAGTNYKRTGHNAVTQYDTNHIFRFPGETVEQDMDTGERISLAVIDEVLMMIGSKRFLTYPMTPCSDGYYHLFISLRQWFRLRTQTNPGQWADITRALLEGGKSYKESAFAKGFVGEYNMTRIHVSDYVTQGVHGTNAYAAVPGVDRAVMVGSNAGAMAFGEDYASGDHLDWIEQTRNYDQWGVAACSTFGFKRTLFAKPNGGAVETYGAYLIPTYEAAS